MPPLVEKTLAPETTTDLLPAAKGLAEDKLSVLENFLASLNLPEDALAGLGNGALALAASFLAALGVDLDLDTSLNPGASHQVSTEFGHCNAPAAAPAAPPENLNAVFEDGIDKEIVYNSDWSPEEREEIDGAIESTVIPESVDQFRKEHGEDCLGGGHHHFRLIIEIGKTTIEPVGAAFVEVTVQCTKCLKEFGPIPFLGVLKKNLN